MIYKKTKVFMKILHLQKTCNISTKKRGSLERNKTSHHFLEKTSALWDTSADAIYILRSLWSL